MVFQFVLFKFQGCVVKALKHYLARLLLFLRAVLQARKIIQEYQPNAVLGMGVCIWPRWHRCKTWWCAGYPT